MQQLFSATKTLSSPDNTTVHEDLWKVHSRLKYSHQKVTNVQRGTLNELTSVLYTAAQMLLVLHYVAVTHLIQLNFSAAFGNKEILVLFSVTEYIPL